MVIKRIARLGAVVCGGLFLGEVAAQPVGPEHVGAVVERFSGDDHSERVEALREIRSSELLPMHEEVRLALFDELERFNGVQLRRYHQWERGEKTSGEDRSYDAEFGLNVLSTVLRLRDVRSIPIITESTVFGGQTHKVLAAWGDEALRAVVATWRGSPERPELHVPLLRAGLLRTMAEMITTDTVSAEGKTTIRTIAHDALELPESVIELQGAIELATAVGDAALLADVRLLAEDPNEVVRRLSDPDHIEPIQRAARRSLEEGSARD